jgi:hypothetical protein
VVLKQVNCIKWQIKQKQKIGYLENFYFLRQSAEKSDRCFSLEIVLKNTMNLYFLHLYPYLIKEKNEVMYLIDLGLEPKRFRCQIPGCDKDDFRYSDLANATNDIIFPKNSDNTPDFCR